MRITKVYTRTGDGGTTRLACGSEVSKADQRVEAMGTIDELSAVLGLARATLGDAGTDTATAVDSVLSTLQNELFDVGAELATPGGELVRIHPQHASQLERQIDTLNTDLEPLREFLLPGGGRAPATLHLARTVCRRAERRVVLLGDEVRTEILAYLNRLSDLLFVLARWVALRSGERELMWENPAMGEP